MSDWLLGAAQTYNLDSHEQRERYSTHLLIPIETMRTVIRWSMESVSYTHLTLPTKRIV